MSYYLDKDDLTKEGQHWTSLSLTHARRLAAEHFMDDELQGRPEIILDIAKMIMGFVSAAESKADTVDTFDIAEAIREAK